MSISDLSIQRPVLTTMVCTLLVVLGGLGLSRLGTDLFPDISVPVISVITVYRGAGPAEVESQIVRPIEDAVAGISGIDTIRGYARDSAGVVLIQFKLEVPLDRALQEVRDKVGAMPALPREADTPRIAKIDVGAQPILTYAVKSDLPTPDLRQLLKERLEPALGQLDGVAQIRVVGGDTRQIRVDIDLDRAKAAGTAPGAIAERIGVENVNIPAGRYELGPTALGVRTRGEFANVEELSNLPIATSTDTRTQVLLSDVATITDGIADRRTVVHLDGAEAVVLEVIKQPGSDTIEVSKRVKARLAEIGPSLGHQFEAKAIIDSSELIQSMIHEVWIAIIFGGLMAVTIIYLFLLDTRGTIISALALPTSITGTFFVMYMFGYTLNLSTLLALALSIGLLIDDAVVVREAITHRLELGEKRAAAASNGTRDVFLAVLATTFSLISVFIPVAFMPGSVGQFFKQFGFTMSAAVMISMFISFTLDPMLSARFSKERHQNTKPPHWVERVMTRVLNGADHTYGRTLGWTLRHPWYTTIITVVIIGLGVLSATTLGNDFMAPMDKNFLIAKLKLPQSASLTQTVTRIDEVTAALQKLPDVTGVYAVAGADPASQSGDGNEATMRILLKKRKERKLDILAIKDAVRKALAELPATEVTLNDPPIVEGTGDFLPLMLYITGPDLNVLRDEGARLANFLTNLRDKKGRPEVTDVQLQSNPAKSELTVDIDRTLASNYGFTSVSLGGQIRLALNGVSVGKLREGDRETDITVRLAPSDRETPEDLKDLEVFSPSGPRAVGDIATIAFKPGPAIIERFNRERSVSIFASNSPTASLGAVTTALEKELKEHPLPPGYSVRYEGQVKVLAEQNQGFAFVFALAFAFVYMVLASQFESFKHPITIMISMPLAVIGAFMALFVTGWSLSLGSMIGVVLLLGLVTKNSILLVDQALQNLRQGNELKEAILRAGPRRLRPILMTSGAMVIGMVPTAVSRGPGFEFMSPMAIGVIGGVITSTFLTLFVVPLFFTVLERITPARFRRWSQPSDAAEPHP